MDALHFYTDSDALGVRWFTRSGWRRTKDDLILEVTFSFLQYLDRNFTNNLNLEDCSFTFGREKKHGRNFKEVS